MAINLGNLNITIGEFHRVSKGDHNAGEVKLVSETRIDKVNNHVTKRNKNNVSLSHEEVLAIKNAFVKALSSSGVDHDELNKVREDLGLAPMKPVDKNLHERSIKPLSRQQIREILDRNADTINEHVGAGTIRKSEQLYARVSPEELETRRNARNATNSELATRRSIIENNSINTMQSVLAGDVDFMSPARRHEMLDMAHECLENVLITCRAHPRDNEDAYIKWETPEGKKVVLATGLSEAALVRKLEDMIVRLSIARAPSAAELAIRDSFKALATPQERNAWAASLIDDPQGAFKARVVAVMIMHDSGIDDGETLSIVNKLDNHNAIAFAQNLAMSGMDLEGNEMRQSQMVQDALGNANPNMRLKPSESAYIPALTAQEFNKEIASNMVYFPEKLPVTYQNLVNDAANEVRAHYGKVGYPDKANSTWLATAANMEVLTGAGNANAPRITAEGLRGNYLRGAIAEGANKVMAAGIKTRLAAAGVNVVNVFVAAKAMRVLEPAIIQSIIAADSLQAADAVLNDYTDQITACGRRLSACERSQALLDSQARAKLADKLGVPFTSLQANVFTTQGLGAKGAALRDAICSGVKNASTDAEIEAEYNRLVDGYVNERTSILAKIDEADLKPDAKAAFKAAVLKMDKIDSLDVTAMVNAAKLISADNLAGLLLGHAPNDQVFNAMRVINTAVTNAVDQMLAAARQKGRETGPDDISNAVEVMMDIIVLSKPALETNLARFLASDAVAGQDVHDEGDLAHPALNFMPFKAQRPGENVRLAGKIGTNALPALHMQALVEAAREEGMGDLSTAEVNELFKRGRPAGDLLYNFTKEQSMPVRASSLCILARSALRSCKETIASIMENMQVVDMIANAFLSSAGVERAREAGFANAELPRIAKTFALYKTATNAADDVALAAALDPTSKASRLMSYGGRFTESVENFKAGLKLIDAFEPWFTKTCTNASNNHPTTQTERFLFTGIVNVASARAMEHFLFSEIAVNGNITLSSRNPEEVFGMENNPAMRFIGRGNTSSCAYSLMQIPQERRDLVYEVFDVIDPFLNGGDPRQTVTQGGLLLSRIMKNYDQVVELRDQGRFNREALVQLLYADLGVAPTATNKEIDKAFGRLVLSTNDLVGPVTMLSIESGAPILEVADAIRQGRRLPAAPYILNFNGHLESLDGTAKEGRQTMVGDLIRPAPASFIINGAPAFPPANNKYVVHFPDNVTLDSITDKNGDANPMSAAKDIADKIATLCGRVHQRQLNSVYFALSQSSLSALRNGFFPQGIDSNEHMALTFTLEKNNETGDVKIRYSEPEGFPIKFSWETTVHTDGSAETTAMAMEVPQGLDFKALAKETGASSFTSSTVAPGNGPAATAMRNIIDTRCGAPENASPQEKAVAFMNKVNTFAAKNMSLTLASVVSTDIIVNKNGHKSLDFESVNFQFNRDLTGCYKIFYPGISSSTGDYNKNRDRLVRFVTDDKKAKFETASESVKKKVGILMSFLTQATNIMGYQSVSGAMALPDTEESFTPLPSGGEPPEFRLSKDTDGNIKINLIARENLQGVVIFGDKNSQPSMMMSKNGSYSHYKMEITLPKDNLETLANADWTQYDGQKVSKYKGGIDGRVALIPEQLRFNGTVNITYHMHLEE